MEHEVLHASLGISSQDLQIRHIEDDTENELRTLIASIKALREERIVKKPEVPQNLKKFLCSFINVIKLRVSELFPA